MTTTTTSSASCATGKPYSCNNCKPTSAEVKEAKATGVVNWICSEGDSKGCICDPEVKDAITIYDVDFNQAVLKAIEKLSVTPDRPIIDCSGEVSDVPSKFVVEKTSSSFCNEVMKDLSKELVDAGTAYDINGIKVPRLKMNKAMKQIVQSKRSLSARSSIERSERYRDYRFYFSYTPKSGDCIVPKETLCRNAYAHLVKSSCGTNHASAGDRMSYAASIDVGCGKFKWQVEKPKEPLPMPTLGRTQCHDKHKHPDVQGSLQDGSSKFGCKKYGHVKLKAGDKAIPWQAYYTWAYGMSTHMWYKVSWIEGCETGVGEQSVEFPVEGNKGINCASMMRANYKGCNNGGAGGYIDAGCLRYDFWAEG
ncbi:hypothetical protein CTRI78_v006634 [Colletotrichum trifolii]|uniref:Uncharacterized protein n=1 Tax=Colletotrichum trifolii TaxID=5466 RepID=A0A4R8RFA6_COLTR|nr:hypothetical protein CTRI78_v006634 [Colletotrichum trifolii]